MSMSQKVIAKGSEVFYVSRHTKKGFYLKKVRNYIASAKEVFFENIDGFRELSGVEVKITVKYSKQELASRKYKELIKTNKIRLYHVMAKTGQYSFDGIVADAIRSLSLEKSKGEFYTILDFIKDIGLKKPDKFLTAMAKLLGNRYKDRDKAVGACADRTIENSINHYKAIWAQIVGYNKELDEVIKRDFRIYVNEWKNRVQIDMTDDSTES